MRVIFKSYYTYRRATYVFVTMVCHKYSWLVAVVNEKLKEESFPQK